MNTIQSNIIKITEDLPAYYMQEILEYAIFIKQKAEKEKSSDTDYLYSIPGMVESIVESSKTDISECSKTLEW
jgi:hypothetical protein